jgi:hypothetical protein
MVHKCNVLRSRNAKFIHEYAPKIPQMLEDAAMAFDKEDLTKSANLHLEILRTLQNLHERQFYDFPWLASDRETENRTYNDIMWLSFNVLHDIALACSYNHEEYKDKSGNCTLNVYALKDTWVKYTTTESIDISMGNKEDEYPRGTQVTDILPLYDPLGRILEKADSFQDAAHFIVQICWIQAHFIQSLISIKKKDRELKTLINLKANLYDISVNNLARQEGRE